MNASVESCIARRVLPFDPTLFLRFPNALSLENLVCLCVCVQRFDGCTCKCRNGCFEIGFV